MRKKIFYVLIFIFSLFFLNNSVFAKTFDKEVLSQYIYDNNMNVTILKADDKVLYSLYPLDILDINYNYEEYYPNNYDLLDISSEEYENICTIAYYGSKYLEEDDLWYIAIQLMIWKTIDEDLEIDVKDSSTNEIIDLQDYYDEIQPEVESYINKRREHKITSIYERPLFIKYLLDYEEVLSPELKVYNGNQVVLEEKYNGPKTYKIARGKQNNAYLYKYTNNILIEVLDLPLIIHNYNVSIPKNTIDITFNDINDLYSNYNGDNKTIYGIYNIYDELVEELSINDNKVYNIELEYGKYYLKQITPGIVYKSDDNIYEFEINKESQSINIDIEKVSKNIIINSTYCDDECKILPNAIFLLDNQEIITDEKGIANIILGAGSYLLSQKEGKEDYKLIEDVIITLDSDIVLNLENKKITHDIEVNVSDIKGKDIKDSKVCLYDNNKNSIECNNSNEEGRVTFEDIKPGNYIVKQEEVVKPYELNKIEEKVVLDADKKINLINYKKEELKPIINNETKKEVDVKEDNKSKIIEEKQETKEIDSNKTNNYVNSDIEVQTDKLDDEVYKEDNKDEADESNMCNFHDLDIKFNNFGFISFIITIIFSIILTRKRKTKKYQ